MHTPDPLRPLRVQVRILWCALLVLTCVAAAANVRPLHVSNADNTPDTDVSLSSPHWTGTLDDARLSVNVPLLSNSILGLSSNLYVVGQSTFDDGGISTDGSGNLTVANGVGIGGVLALYSGLTGYNGQTLFDNYSDFTTPGFAQIAGSLTSDGGAFSTDGSGNFSANTGVVSGTVTAYDSVYAPRFYGDGSQLSNIVTSINGYTGEVGGADLVAGADITPGSVQGWFVQAHIYGAVYLDGAGIDLGSDKNIGFNPTGYVPAFSGQDNDAGLSRSAPGTLAVGNGAVGDASGTYRASNLRLLETATPPATVASEATFWIKSSDHKLHVVDSAGTDHALW